MNVKEKAAPVLQLQDGGGQIALEDFEVPRTDSTTGSRRLQAISALLLHGEANAIPLCQLAAMTGLDRRVVRRLIQHERQAGACICVNCRDGYYLAETETERDACARSMFHRAAEIQRTAKAIADAEVVDNG